MTAGKMIYFAVLLLSVLFCSAAQAAVDGPVAARDLVLDELLEGDTAGRMLMAHPDALPAGTAIATWRKTAMTTPAAGYVVFVDDMAFANFEHPCRYVFVDAATGALIVTDAMTPPVGAESWLHMETDAYRAVKSARNVRAPRKPAPRGPAPKTEKGGDFYAVLMSGGASQYSNHVRYWNDLSNIYITLVDVYAYKDQNIIVLCSDGLDPAPDQSNGLNSHPDLDGDGDDDIMYSCIKSNIQLVFTQLAAQLSPADQLFVFTTDHGGSNGGWDTYLNLWNMEELADSELETMYAALPPCNVITTMEQCYSGGFLDNLSQNLSNQVFSSAARYDEYSWAMPPNYEYDTYVFFWTAAVKGEDAYGVPCDADYNKDGMVSMSEAFIYAELNDFSNETPQYNSNPPLLGELLSLGTGPALTIWVTGGVTEGIVPPGPENRLSLEIEAGEENYVPGSGYLHYRFSPGATWVDVPLTPLGNDTFEATLPGARPGDEPAFYFSCRGDLGATVTLPGNAPTDHFSLTVGLDVPFFHDNFERDLNWNVYNHNITSGGWERAAPNVTGGGQVAPVEDNPAGTGRRCYVTENGPPGGHYTFYEVNGGPTYLMSDQLDLSAGDALFSAYVWYYTDSSADRLRLDFSENSGLTWRNARTFNSSLNGWERISFPVSDYITPGPMIRLRFTVEDAGSDSIVEAGVDDVRFERFDPMPTLWADAYSFSAAAGCDITFDLDAGAARAGRGYLMSGGMSGSYPGTPLPGGKMFPVNWDWLANYIVTTPASPYFPNSAGSLDGQGRATAGFVLPGPGAVPFTGRTMTFAYALTGTYDFVSNPMFIRIEP